MEETEYLNSLYKRGFLRISQIVGDKYATPPIPPIVPIGKSTLWLWVRKGYFPKPIKLGPRSTAWRISDVEAWLTEREKGSDE